MLKREIKEDLKSRNTVLIISSIFMVFVITFIIIKNEFYFNVINYIPTYLRYYISEYLGGDISGSINNNIMYLHIENELQNVMSSFFIYVASFGVGFCKILLLVIPFIIFIKINKTLFSEINNKYSICKITRIGRKKYYRNLILKNGLIAGLIMILPRIIYLIILMIFFPTGISKIHVLDYSYLSFMTPTYSYINYAYSPYTMIGLDFLVAYIYGFSISSLSIIIISTIKNKPLTYVIFVFVLGILSILPELINAVPYIFYSSLYYYCESLEGLDFNIYYSVINIVGFNTLISFLAKIMYKRGVEKSL